MLASGDVLKKGVYTIELTCLYGEKGRMLDIVGIVPRHVGDGLYHADVAVNGIVVQGYHRVDATSGLPSKAPVAAARRPNRRVHGVVATSERAQIDLGTTKINLAPLVAKVG